MRNCLLVIGAAVAGAVVGPPLPSHAQDAKTAIDEVVRPFVNGKSYLGVIVGITRPGTRHEYFAYGQVTVDGKQQAPAADTIFEIGSITKVFTGTLFADQVRAGNVKLDDRVQKYLPADLRMPRRDDRDISLLHLATHTSGLPVQPPYLGLFALTTKDPTNPYAHFDQDHLGRTLAGIRLTRPIGSQFAYSNLGVGLLGQALAGGAGTKCYEDLLVQRVLEPLALDDTRIHLSPEQTRRFAQGCTRTGENASPWTFASLEACGGLRSTASDLLTFLDAASGQRTTSLASAFRLAEEAWRETPKKAECVGLCWFRQELGRSDQVRMWHNGGTGGYRSYMAVEPATHVGVVILSNSPHPVDDLGVRILTRLNELHGK